LGPSSAIRLRFLPLVEMTFPIEEMLRDASVVAGLARLAVIGRKRSARIRIRFFIVFFGLVE
tara:strand:- start:2861 stop:3046 length:186 start_codon:yes stop_codon:yes gene_type:complete